MAQERNVMAKKIEIHKSLSYVNELCMQYINLSLRVEWIILRIKCRKSQGFVKI